MDVEAFSFKEGPTESGSDPNFIKRIPEAIGGEILPFNLLEAFPKYWLLLLVLLIPVFVVIYKKRNLALNLLSRII